MKTNIKLIAVSLAFCVGLFALNAAEKIQAGPRGGRILEKTSPTAEFFVEKDHTVAIRFYDAALKPVSPVDQTVSVIADAKGGRQKLDFEKKGDALVSTTKLPAGGGYNIVLQFKASPAAKPNNYRFLLDLSTCGGCKRAEYACSCHE